MIFVKEGKECHKPRLILVATVFYLPYIGKDDGVMYPIETMRRTLDWVNVIAYDIFTPISSSNETGPSSALFNNPSKATLGGYFGIRTWIEKGMPTKRMIFGLPFHGWAWKLERSYNHNVFSPAQGPAQGQNISMEGLIEYRNVKKFIADNDNATNVPIDHKYPIAYTHCDNTWIAYEIEETITAKIAKAKINLAMLGYFASNIAADDDHHSLAKAALREWRKVYSYYWW